MFQTRMSKKIAKSIILWIILLESAFLLLSYYGKKTELNQLRVRLETDVRNKYNQDFHELHPGILDKKDIEDRMNVFLKNIIIMTLILVFFVVNGVIIIFNQQIGRHIVRLKLLNTMQRGPEIAKWRHYEDIPDNEVGDLIIERERMISAIPRK